MIKNKSGRSLLLSFLASGELRKMREGYFLIIEEEGFLPWQSLNKFGRFFSAPFVSLIHIKFHIRLRGKVRGSPTPLICTILVVALHPMDCGMKRYANYYIDVFLWICYEALANTCSVAAFHSGCCCSAGL
jgi:hypothetical protein